MVLGNRGVVMSTTKNFQISEQMLSQYGQELLMWGQEKKLEPHELAIVLKLMQDWLFKRIGISNMRTEKIV
jgi:hypothetical protein